MAETQIGIIANPHKEGAAQLLEQLTQAFADHGITSHLEKVSAELLGQQDGVELHRLSELCDLLVVLGGDGSLLWVLSQLKGKVKPLAGINIGTLGFLSCATGDEYQNLVDAIVSHQYKISQRAIVKATLMVDEQGQLKEAGVFFGLNEVTISRAASSRTIQIEARVDGSFVNHYSGDGVILATPTGSTAYSLSAGGPIIDPAAGVFSLTPICPHALANRAIVMSDSSEIELLMPAPRDPLLLSIDGRAVAEIQSAAEVKIERAAFDLPLLALPEASFYEVLHQKLGWFASTVVQPVTRTGK
ncbi:MAG: NAD(+)/NADH kinase [Verrucomicrobiales bacterium]|nr:NAD(+)/NADH kinase [Verrucomicrobiales bacterium]